MKFYGLRRRMNNAEKFMEIFGIYATEMWAMSESDLLEWLNIDYEESQSEEVAHDSH